MDVYHEYGNHLGTFEVDSDYSHNFSQLQGAIEDAAETAVDKYINYLKHEVEILYNSYIIREEIKKGILYCVNLCGC